MIHIERPNLHSNFPKTNLAPQRSLMNLKLPDCNCEETNRVSTSASIPDISSLIDAVSICCSSNATSNRILANGVRNCGHPASNIRCPSNICRPISHSIECTWPIHIVGHVLLPIRNLIHGNRHLSQRIESPMANDRRKRSKCQVSMPSSFDVFLFDRCPSKNEPPTQSVHHRYWS